MRRWGRRVLRLVAGLVAATVVGTSVQLVAAVVAPVPASAVPIGPDPKCAGHEFSLHCQTEVTSPVNVPCDKKAPTPQAPGSGFAGSIDPGQAVNHPAAGDIYGRSWYPPPWSTYDLGCVGQYSDVWVPIDTGFGNWERGFATSLVALCNAVHRFVDPPTFLAVFDPLLTQASQAVNDALFAPYLELVLLFIGAGLIFASRKGNFAHTVQAAAWAILVMTVVEFATGYCVWIERGVLSVATAAVDSVNQHMPGAGTGDPAEARAELLTNNVLYTEWLQGELGSATSVSAHKYGMRLLDDQTLTYADAARIAKDPKAAAGINKAKQADFVKVAAELQTNDPDAYDHLKGEAKSRAGFGVLMVAAAVDTTPIMTAADGFIVAGAFIVIITLCVAPLIGLVGMPWRYRSIIFKAFDRWFTALVVVVGFAVGGALSALSVGLLFGGTTQLPVWLQIALAGLFNYLLWRVLRKLPYFNKAAKGARHARKHARRGAALYNAAGLAALGWVTSRRRGGGAGGRGDGQVDDDVFDPVDVTEPAGRDGDEPGGEVWEMSSHDMGQYRWGTEPRLEPPSRPALPAPPMLAPRAPGDPDVIDLHQQADGAYGAGWGADPAVTREGARHRIWDPDTDQHINLDGEGDDDGGVTAAA